MADGEIPVSKTRRKQEMRALQDVGEKLVALNSGQLAQLELPEELHAAVTEAKRMRAHEALRRQMQYIGKLMRAVDPAPIVDKLNGWQGTSRQHSAWLHLIERWRERLLQSEDAFADLTRDHPGADLNRLRTLVRNAHKERLANKPPKSFRALFQELRELIPEPAANAGRLEHRPDATPISATAGSAHHKK